MEHGREVFPRAVEFEKLRRAHIPEHVVEALGDTFHCRASAVEPVPLEKPRVLRQVVSRHWHDRTILHQVHSQQTLPFEGGRRG